MYPHFFISPLDIGGQWRRRASHLPPVVPPRVLVSSAIKGPRWQLFLAHFISRKGKRMNVVPIFLKPGVGKGLPSVWRRRHDIIPDQSHCVKIICTIDVDHRSSMKASGSIFPRKIIVSDGRPRRLA